MKKKKTSDAYRKEKIIMIAGSVLVLTAVAVTGVSVYQENKNEEQQEHIVDFSALEQEQEKYPAAQAQSPDVENFTSDKQVGELDYDPYYAQQDAILNSLTGLKENAVPQKGNKAGEETETGTESIKASESTGTVGYSEITDGKVTYQGATQSQEKEASEPASEGENTAETGSQESDAAQRAASSDKEALEAVANALQEEKNLYFDKDSVLMWPLVGNVLLNYSMDKTVYFPTLQQYKYNPAIVVSATQGANVACAADCVVKAIYEDPQTGWTVVMNLGNGYELTYGQLTDIMVEEGDFVETGVFVGKVAAPTKYYTKEGTNVHIRLTCDQEPVNPLDFLN